MRSSLVFITALSVLLHSLFPLLFSSLPTSPLVTKTEPSSSSPALGELFFDLSWRCSWPVINIREQLSPLPSSRRRRCPADFSRTPLSPSSKGKASRFASYSKNRAARKEDRSSDVELFRAWASVWIPRGSFKSVEKLRYLEFQRMGTVVKCSLFWNYEKELLIFNSLDLLFLREFQLNPLSQKAIILTRGNSFPFFQTIQERGHGALYMLVNFFLKKKSSVSFHVSMPFPSIILVRERKPHGFHARESARTRFRELELQGRQGPPTADSILRFQPFFVCFNYAPCHLVSLAFVLFNFHPLSTLSLCPLVSSKFHRSKFIISDVLFRILFLFPSNPSIGIR